MLISITRINISCSTGTCAIATCNTSYWNTDGIDGNGCECFSPTVNTTCATAKVVAQVVMGASISNSAALPPQNPDSWYTVSFGPGPGGPTPVPTISLTGSGYLMDVYSNCAGGTLATSSTSFMWMTPVQGVPLYVHVHGTGAQGCGAYNITFSY